MAFSVIPPVHGARPLDSELKGRVSAGRGRKPNTARGGGKFEPFEPETTTSIFGFKAKRRAMLTSRVQILTPGLRQGVSLRGPEGALRVAYPPGGASH